MGNEMNGATHPNGRTTRDSKKLIFALICLALMAFGSFSGCYYSRWVEFNPFEHEAPISMFDTYEMEIRGYLSHGRHMAIDVHYIRDVTDTNSIETLPMLVLDSICLRGACLPEEFCIAPMDWRAQNKELNARDPSFPGYNYGTELSRKDLYLIDGKVTPTGWGLPDYSLSPFPEACSDTSVSVEIKARLLDFNTGREIHTENLLLRFRVEPKKQWEPMS